MRESLAGTGELLRFVVRRDRVRIAVWVVGIGVLVVLSAASVKGLFPTQHDLDAAMQAERSAAAIIFNGPPLALNTIGGQVAYQLSTFELIVVGLMSSLMIGRLVRGEEESGRLEMVRSLPVSAHAPTAAALVVVAGMDLAVGVVTTVGLIALGLPATGSIILGMAVALLGLVFAAIAMVTAQVTENTRVVHGITGVILGASFIVRGIGDIGDGRWSWLSPIGWAQKTRPFAGEAWWPLLVLLAVTAATTSVAARLSTRRDLGGALIHPRPGPATGDASLRGPFGLALRLHRGAITGWAAGVFAIGVAYGSIGDSVDQYIQDNKAMAKLFQAAGGASITDSYFATTMTFTALLVAAYALQAALKPRTEEAADRAEFVVATSLSRDRWLLSHVATTILGSTLITTAGAVGTGVTYGVVTSHWAKVLSIVAAGFAYLPAVWLLAAIAVALYGLAPRASAAAWATLAWCIVVGILGDLLDLPMWLRDISPLQHTPRVPAAAWSATPLVTMAAIAAVLLVVGVKGFERRDLGVAG